MYNYCERKSSLLSAEPINVISNASFILVGLALLFVVKKDHQAVILSLMLVTIGIASALYHAFANILTGVLDVLSILLFASTYFFLVNRRILSLSRINCYIAILIFIIYLLVSEFILFNLGLRINGSEAYLPLLVLLVSYAIVISVMEKKVNIIMFLSFFGLLMSLAFRTFDKQICANLSFGTHFIWHILNGGCLGMLILSFFKYSKKMNVQPLRNSNEQAK